MTYPSELEQVDKYDRAILLAISESRNLHHNKLKKMLVEEQKIMATRTFDLHIKKLSKQKKILSFPHGRKKYYGLNVKIDRKGTREKTREHSGLTQQNIELLEKYFSDLALRDKITLTTFYLKQLLANISHVYMPLSLMMVLPGRNQDDIEDRKVFLETVDQMQECMVRILKVIIKDPDRKAILDIILSESLGIEGNKEADFPDMLKHCLQNRT